MSVVERALRNLKKASSAGGAAGERTPIARVAGSLPRRADDSGGQAFWQSRSEKIEFDLAALRDAGLYPMGNQRLADEYRILKRPILKAAADRADESHRRRNLVMVASALQGEGKTFTSVNLAMSLSGEKDWEVLLADVDCKNPQLSRLLGVDGHPGLLNWLRDPALGLESVVLPTNIDRLSVLPSGTLGDDSSELLASNRMGELANMLSARDRKLIVVFDSSPLLLTTEPIVLSSQVGQVLVVVDAWKTPQQAVVDAVDKLDPATPIGLVLNRAERGEALGYGYGYGSSAYEAATRV